MPHTEFDPCRCRDREQTGQRRFEHGDELRYMLFARRDAYGVGTQLDVQRFVGCSGV